MTKKSSITLLHLETSTQLCSVALSVDHKVVAEREVNEHKAHARVIATFIEEVLKEASLKVSDCSAVVISEGPGSYTGLRVGTSIAKGLCYGAGIPLIAVNSLELLARLTSEAHIEPKGNYKIIPMIDARRMEVYTAIFDKEFNRLTETEAHILTAQSFSEILSEGDVVFIGDGAHKFSQLTASKSAIFINTSPTARGMVIPALEKYKKGLFCDIAYFEPFYLKDFIAGISKKALI